MRDVDVVILFVSLCDCAAEKFFCLTLHTNLVQSAHRNVGEDQGFGKIISYVFAHFSLAKVDELFAYNVTMLRKCMSQKLAIVSSVSESSVGK